MQGEGIAAWSAESVVDTSQGGLDSIQKIATNAAARFKAVAGRPRG